MHGVLRELFADNYEDCVVGVKQLLCKFISQYPKIKFPKIVKIDVERRSINIENMVGRFFQL